MNPYIAYVEKHRNLILDAVDYIWKNPETGYKEWKTHAYLEKAFTDLGYELTKAGNIPGFTALVDTGREGPTVAVFGELDSVLCAAHPEADPETGAVHACGHCAQAAALLGLAAALKEPGALDGLCGKILLVAVPAEELLEVEFREELKKKGIIRYFGGKAEFMSRGLLDGVDMAIMVHTSGGSVPTASINAGSNGCLVKNITFEGVSAHAGAAPYKGVNALYAANLAMNAVNALRETFKDSSHIRFHPIITNGGDAVNVIPNRVCMESYVRGATMNEIVEVNRKVNRAIAASAAAIGAKVHLRDIPGYWPRKHPESFFPALRQAMEQVVDNVKINATDWGAGCSDMGDVGAVMPALHPYISGSVGTAHGNDYLISDPDTACIKSAALQLVYLSIILGNDAAEAKRIIADYEPDFSSMQDYLAFMDKLNLDMDAVSYEDDVTAVLNFGAK
ncbi:MAG: amidohydrolase [Oscillospiraceae bacterium]|nr:amidohydrolase [Oscillospiraceae bacterium]